MVRSPCLVWRGSNPGAIPSVEGCLLGQPPLGSNYDVILWGDSHAAQLVPVLEVLAIRLSVTARVITKAGCGPLPGVRFTQDKVIEAVPECPEFNEAAMQAILKHRPGIIILACRWDAYATGNHLISESSSARPSLAESRNSFVSALRSTILALTQVGHRVIIIGQVPLPNGNPIDCIERIVVTGRDASECAAASASRAEVESKVNQLLHSAVENLSDVSLILRAALRCAGMPDLYGAGRLRLYGRVAFVARRRQHLER